MKNSYYIRNCLHTSSQWHCLQVARFTTRSRDPDHSSKIIPVPQSLARLWTIQICILFYSSWFCIVILNENSRISRPAAAGLNRKHAPISCSCFIFDTWWMWSVKLWCNTPSCISNISHILPDKSNKKVSMYMSNASVCIIWILNVISSTFTRINIYLV